MTESISCRNFEKVNDILEKYDYRPSNLISILQEVQEIYRYLPEEILTYISTAMGIAPARVFGVATFYENFSLEPKGKNVIKVCDGTACHVRKSDKILSTVRETLNLKNGAKTTDDMLFTLETVSCLGACGLAPVVVVNDRVYGNMTPEIQGIGVIGFAYRGSEARVTPPFNKNISQVNCVDCGQCAAVCPTGSITVASHMEKVWNALYDPAKTVVAQIAPAVRVSLGEEFGLKPGAVTSGKIIGALKKMGFDMVFDTCFAADLTAVEESHEFLERLSGKKRLPQFTSCCPAWVKYVELNYPDFKDNLSSCKSPQQMFGSAMKGIYAKRLGIDPEEIFVVSIMPCTAKKAEAQREEFSKGGIPDVDAVLATQEMARMVRQAGIIFDEVEELPFDMPLGFATGGGLIFGGGEGVATAVIRTLGREPVFRTHGEGGQIKTAEIEYDGKIIKAAAVSGLNNAKKLLEDIRDGKEYYDLVEVMACSGGCVGGGGQPQPNTDDARESRKKGLLGSEKLMQLKSPAENPIIKDLYRDHLYSPGSEKAHELLHTTYRNRKRIGGEICFSEDIKKAGKVSVKVCVGTCCYLSGSYDLFSALKEIANEERFKDRIELSATFCLENCAQSPCAMVDDILIGKATVEKVIDEVLKKV
ncbi:MAG: [FeFe] hydrogenase, group A [Tepidanaerobacteraceae bacterium]|nr:[FeFe] hydrogenase, group A [Tepidanaerobacteraceae bacterium]